MGYAPVIAFDRARRRAMALQLLDMGVTKDRICATKTDGELADLWARERTIRSLTRLTGHGRHALDLMGTPELQELERRALRHLMGCDGRSFDGLVTSITGRQRRQRPAA